MLSLTQRNAWLDANVAPGGGVQLAHGVETAGEALFALAVDQDIERVVGKQMDSPYRAGPQSTWRKIKNRGYSRPAAFGVRNAG